jgi:UDP-glucose 4-epimerase
MNILVTGGSGFIGTNLIKELKKNKSNNIYALDNCFSSKPQKDIIKLNTWDIRELNNLKIDLVYHFGEYSRVVPSFKDAEYVWTSNLWGTSFVLEQCVKWKAKIIYSASSSKFGNNENLCPYSWSKSKMVELIKNYNEWFGLQYEICYFYNVYGEHQISKGDYATVLGIFEEQYKNKKSLSVVEPGTQTRHFTHVKDIVDGLIKTNSINKNYEWYLQNKKEYTILEVAKMFTDDISMIPSRRGERDKSITIENDTEKLLNWKPKYKLIDWIKNIKNGQK